MENTLMNEKADITNKRYTFELLNIIYPKNIQLPNDYQIHLI